jgi:hypothetical protein
VGDWLQNAFDYFSFAPAVAGAESLIASPFLSGPVSDALGSSLLSDASVSDSSDDSSSGVSWSTWGLIGAVLLGLLLILLLTKSVEDVI